MQPPACADELALSATFSTEIPKLAAALMKALSAQAKHIHTSAQHVCKLHTVHGILCSTAEKLAQMVLSSSMLAWRAGHMAMDA